MGFNSGFKGLKSQTASFLGVKFGDSRFLQNLCTYQTRRSALCSYYHEDYSSDIVTLQGKPATSNYHRFFETWVKKAKLLIILYPKTGGDIFSERSVTSADYKVSYPWIQLCLIDILLPFWKYLLWCVYPVNNELPFLCLISNLMHKILIYLHIIQSL